MKIHVSSRSFVFPRLLASVPCQEADAEDESQLLYLVDQSADEFGLKDVT